MSARIVFLLFLISFTLAAQSGTAIFGTVTDSTGAAVANADLTAINAATGVAEKVKSNSGGYYIFLDLRPGTYRVNCAVAGFETVERTGILLEVDKDKGLANFNVKSRFVTSAIWDVPFFHGSKSFTKAILDGWSINGILTLQTGIPFTVLAGVDRSLSGVGSDHADAIAPAATYNGAPNSSKLAHYFDTSAFAMPALGTFGTAGRNTLVGPGTENLDAGIFKDIPINESKKFQLRWEVFNGLNRANFANPNASFSSTNFGKILSAKDPRIMQLAAKFYF